MTNYLQTIALLEMALTCASAIILLICAFQIELPLPVRILVGLVLANLFFWPLGLSMALPLSGYVRGVTGDLSVLTMLLIWSSAFLPSQQAPMVFRLPIALLAVTFYPFALGIGMTDPYSWGYGSIGLLAGMVLFAAVCGFAGWTKGVWMIALAMIAWSAQWHESRNLWDYVLDPFLALWAIGSILHSIYRKRRNKARSGFLFRAG